LDETPVRFQPLDPGTPFPGSDGTPLADLSVLDFWRWGYSNVLNNTSRGRLAEFIVSKAIGARLAVANEWAAYDLETPEGIKVEVKSAAYVQDWHKEGMQRQPPRPFKPSRIVFGIRPTVAWDSDTARFMDENARQRQAAVYVFCLLGEQDHNRVDPLDISQWRFYVVPTARLNQKDFHTAKTLSLRSVELLTKRVSISELAAAVSEAAAAN